MREQDREYIEEKLEKLISGDGNIGLIITQRLVRLIKSVAGNNPYEFMLSQADVDLTNLDYEDCEGDIRDMPRESLITLLELLL